MTDGCGTMQTAVVGDPWIAFFAPVLGSDREAHEFVDPLESLEPGNPRHRAKIMMHQTQRLVSLADDVRCIRPNRESLQLLFLLICAENTAKLYADYEGDGESRRYVRQFFEQFVVGRDLQTIEQSFPTLGWQPRSLREIVDLLYGVRCDVVHEGKYWGFHFHDGRTAILNTDPDVVVSITFPDFRDIVVCGCIRAVRAYPARKNV